MRKLLATLAAASIALAALAPVVSAGVEITPDCQNLYLTTDNLDNSIVSVYEATVTDSWTDIEVVDGVADAVGIFPPGDYLAVWQDGTVEEFTIDCEPPGVNENQDPNEADICNWVEPGEFVEGCSIEGQSTDSTAAPAKPAEKTRATRRAPAPAEWSARGWLPPTDTAP